MIPDARRPTPDDTLEDHPQLSVVVIGRNEGERLVRCLQSVRAMQFHHGPMELIYVDSDSTDGSSQRAAALGAIVHAVSSPVPNAARARNVGCRMARAPLILFLDADTTIHPRFVVDAWSELQRPEVAVIAGRRRERDPDASVFQQVLDLDWLGPTGDAAYCGGDALMRRDAVVDAGGFDESLIAGEEPELCSRLRARGWVVRRLDMPMTLHDLGIQRFSQYWRRAVRTGHAYAEVAQRTAANAAPLWGAEVRHNRLHAAALLTLPPLTVAAAWSANSLIPIIVALAFAVLAVVRTAWRARWRTTNRRTLLLYAVHAHLQQIPIFIGQLSYHLRRLMVRPRSLIEYKEPT